MAYALQQTVAELIDQIDHYCNFISIDRDQIQDFLGIRIL